MKSKDLPLPDLFTLQATIMAFGEIITYLGCPKCKKKVLGGTDKKIYTKCASCEIEVPEPEDIYAFQMQLTDGTERIWVRVFAELGQIVLGATATKFVQEKKALKSGELHPRMAEAVGKEIVVGVRKKTSETGEVVYVAVQVYEKSWKKLATALLKRVEIYENWIH